METASSPVELCQQNNVPASLPLTASAASMTAASAAGTACSTLRASSALATTRAANCPLRTSSALATACATYRTLSTASSFTMAAMRRCLRDADGGDGNHHQSAQQHFEDPSTRPTR